MRFIYHTKDDEHLKDSVSTPTLASFPPHLFVVLQLLCTEYVEKIAAKTSVM